MGDWWRRLRRPGCQLGNVGVVLLLLGLRACRGERGREEVSRGGQQVTQRSYRQPGSHRVTQTPEITQRSQRGSHLDTRGHAGSSSVASLICNAERQYHSVQDLTSMASWKNKASLLPHNCVIVEYLCFILVYQTKGNLRGRLPSAASAPNVAFSTPTAEPSNLARKWHRSRSSQRTGLIKVTGRVMTSTEHTPPGLTPSSAGHSERS